MSEFLAEKTCTPCRVGIPPLTRDDAPRLQQQAPDWELRDDAREAREMLAERIPCGGGQGAAHLRCERGHGRADRAGTGDGRRGPVEGREYAIARGVDRTPAVLLQHFANFCEECGAQFGPG